MNNDPPYAAYVSADTKRDGTPRIQARCCHCPGRRHWFPLLREVHCPRTLKPLRISMAAILRARAAVR